jgi:hypothetical protein
MAFDTATRNRLNQFVGNARKLLTDEFTILFQVDYGLDPNTGEISELDRLSHLDDTRRQTAIILREILDHYYANLPTKNENQRTDYQQLIQRIIREQAFTVLNRLCAIRMAEARDLVIESIGVGVHSKGFQLYLHVVGTSLGDRAVAYHHFLYSLFDELAVDLPVLFDRFSPQGRLFPRETALNGLIKHINDPEINQLWAEDETIGWIYQYFNSKEERKAMRDASQAPRNSRELAVRNQFFTPRYVVEFLTDNTLGRIWYEMRQGETGLKDECSYLVRRPNEIFLAEGGEAPELESTEGEKDLTQEELHNQPVHIPHRPLKDPREIRMLDPACGSMHFGLYAFDLYLKIYEEYWDLVTSDPSVVIEPTELPPLTEVYESQDAYLRDVPRLIIEHNIHGIDIDPRAVQIAGLSLWLRAQRAWKSQGLTATDRPKVERSNVVCAEPMPGDKQQLESFCNTLHPTIAQMVTAIFEEMKLAGEAGSLLKIEQEISSLVAAAKKQFHDNPPDKKTQMQLFGDADSGKQQLEFDLSGITEEQFFERAEEEIYEALRKYASETSEGGFRRKLFANDAEKGFAFIECMKTRYDVALMNPPFGASSAGSKNYINGAYPATKGDLLANFVERMSDVATPAGLVGAISSRTPFFLGSFDGLRESVLANDAFVSLLADLGEGVLDATVEVAIYVLNKQPSKQSIFFRVLLEQDKGIALLTNVTDVIEGNYNKTTFLIPCGVFSRLSGSPYAYWISDSTIEKLSEFETIDENLADICVGLQTGDDNRYLRLLWEVPIESLSISPAGRSQLKSKSARRVTETELTETTKWVAYSKTDSASPWYSPITLAVNWQKNGWELKNFTNSKGKLRSRPQNEAFYFRPGFSYMLRSTRLVPYIVPSGVMPTAGRSQVYPAEGMEYRCLAICASNLGSAVARFSGEKFAWPKFQKGMVQTLPVTDFSPELLTRIQTVVEEQVDMKRDVVTGYEPFLEFSLPAFLRNSPRAETTWDLMTLLGDEIESAIANEYSLSRENLCELERDIREAVEIRTGLRVNGNNEEDDDDSEALVEATEDTNELRGWGMLSYLVGAAFGRWDLRAACNTNLVPQLPSPFEPLPVVPPAMLVGDDGLPATRNNIASVEWLETRETACSIPSPMPKNSRITSDEYKFRVAWEGVLVHDTSISPMYHELDICVLTRSDMYGVFKEECDTKEQEMFKFAGVKDFKDAFAKTSKFFEFHLDSYSKSRRSAPIYWPISTGSGSYTLWFYYHRLTDQTLYKAVNDFVDPKLKNVARQLADLRAIKDRSSAQETELVELTELESELGRFKADLLEIAAFWKPNLNDGVQITAAPLHKFFRLKKWRDKLKKTWEELESGKYDWAHLSLSIWPERVVKEKCTTDRSIAIAHDLEEQLWHEVEVRKTSKTEKTSTKMEWQPRDLPDSKLDAIIEAVKAGTHRVDL